MSDDSRLQLLRVLSCDLRVATVVQLGAIWEGADRRIQQLCRRGLVCTRFTPVALPELAGPTYRWRPGFPAPDFDAVAWTAAKRREETPVKRRLVVWATRSARRLVGGVGVGLRQPLQLEHDLGVAGIYFAKRRSDVSAAQRWCGEDAYRLLRRPTRGQKAPDGVLLCPEGHLQLVVDYLTRYPPGRLRSFHRFWSDRRVPYEWW